MKKAYKIYLLFLSIFLAVGFYSCDDRLPFEDSDESYGLKSASTDKQSYIVQVDDYDLNTELSAMKGYEKKGKAVEAAAQKILKRAGIDDGELENTYSTAIKGFSVKIAPGQLKKLEGDLSVVSVEKDQIILLHPMVKPGPVTPPAESTPWGIARVGGPANGAGKTAWVIDTGIDLDHPDLNVDKARAKTFVSRTTTADDDNGHGSHVAGIIAALDNTIGVVGVAAGASVVPVKVLDKRGSGSVSVIIAGIDYVADSGSSGDVANMSLGGGVSTTLDAAVLNASNTGIKFVLAAGNESDDAIFHSPARVNGPNIYTISAMDSKDNFASFSNYGSPVDFCAPGVSILSCYKSAGYATLSGTSMAAPHVAGILLMGNPHTDGFVNNDPDGDPDPIAHL